MNLDDLELRNTQVLMDEIAARVPLEDDVALIALVDRPATAQRLLDVRRLAAPVRQHERTRDLSDLLYDEMHSLAIPPRDPHIRAVVVTVLVRTGIVGWGPAEWAWAMAWRYSNHNTDAFAHEIISVTEHGWASLWSHAAGRSPAAIAPAA